MALAEVVIQANIFCAAVAVQEVVMQQGSLIRSKRKHGPDVWQFRWSEKEADRAVVAPNAAFMPTEEIQRRLNSVQLSVRLGHGTGQWFVLLVENESSKNIDIEEMVLETKEGHRLADPAHPKSGEEWKLGPKEWLSMSSQLQPDPCVQILTLHEWPEANFATDVNFKFLCRILDQKK